MFSKLFDLFSRLLYILNLSERHSELPCIQMKSIWIIFWVYFEIFTVFKQIKITEKIKLNVVK